MDNGIDDGFAQGGFIHHTFLSASRISDFGECAVFGFQTFEHSVCGGQQATVAVFLVFFLLNPWAAISHCVPLLQFGNQVRGVITVSLLYIDCVFVKKELWGIGIVEVKNGFGDTVRTYDMEKTIGNILRKYGSLDVQLITDALRQFVARRDKNLNCLSRYAALLRVEKSLRRYLEVLL